MREDELKKQLKEFPQTQKIDDDRKEEMKQSLRKEVGKEPKPFQKRKWNPWMTGLAGVAALVIMVVSILAITNGEPQYNPKLADHNVDDEQNPSLHDKDKIKAASQSPDGNKLIYVEVEDGKLMLKLQNREKEEKKTFFQTPSNYHNFSWSPNGNYVMYLSAGVSPKKSWIINVDNMKVINSNPYSITGNPVWSEGGNQVLFGEEGQELSRVMLYDFEEDSFSKIHEAKQEGIRYSVENWDPPYIKVITRYLEENRSTPTLLTEENGEWVVLDEKNESTEPGSKDAIIRNLRTKENVEVANITWSPDESYVVYTESPINLIKKDVYIWEVGESEPQLIDMKDETHTVEGFKWNENSTHFIELYSFGGSNRYLWSVVNAEEERRTKRFPATHEPQWSPDGTRVAYVEGIQEELESGVRFYEALKVFELSSDLIFDSSGNRKYRMQTLFETEESARSIEVKPWRDSSHIMATHRAYMGNETTTFHFEEEYGEWKRDVNMPVNVKAFTSPIYFGRRVLREDPYSLWDEVKSKEVVLGENQKVTVALYNANGVNRVFLKYQDKWFFVQDTKLEEAEISTESITQDKYNEITITGKEVQDGEEVSIKHIISLQPNDEQGNNFDHLAAIPHYEQVDLDNNGEPEILSIQNSQIVMYVASQKRVGKINIKQALGMQDHSIELKEMDGEYVFEFQSEQTGEVKLYKFVDYELVKVKGNL